MRLLHVLATEGSVRRKEVEWYGRNWHMEHPASFYNEGIEWTSKKNSCSYLNDYIYKLDLWNDFYLYNSRFQGQGPEMNKRSCAVGPKQKCYLCGLSLAVPPVMMANSGNNEIYKCGRCKDIISSAYSWIRTVSSKRWHRTYPFLAPIHRVQRWYPGAR